MSRAASLQPGEVLVHFGMPKTGSSSIQYSLARKLADARFHYMGFGKTDANAVVATAFKAKPQQFYRHKHSGVSQAELRALQQQARDSLNAELSGAKIGILSSEVLANMQAGEVGALMQFLAERRRAPVAAAYVRSPKAFMESTFQQRVKAGTLQGLPLERLYPRYREKVEKFDAALGRERVRLWPFEPRAFPDGCVVQDFCARVGIAFRPEDVIRVNEGLSLPALSLLFAYRKFGPGMGTGPGVARENRRLVRRLIRLSGAKVRLHSSLVAPVLKAQRTDIEWMESRLGASLAEEVAADDAHAIRGEDDLLRFAPEALQWLAGELGPGHAARFRAAMTGQDVADCMHQLRLKLAAADGARAAEGAAHG